MFFYTVMNLFITLRETVNKWRTSAGNVSVTFVGFGECEIYNLCICNLTFPTKWYRHNYSVNNIKILVTQFTKMYTPATISCYSFQSSIPVFQPGRGEHRSQIGHLTCDALSLAATDRMTHHFTIFAIWPTYLAIWRCHVTTAQTSQAYPQYRRPLQCL
jgi:hypothetical protein